MQCQNSQITKLLNNISETTIGTWRLLYFGLDGVHSRCKPDIPFFQGFSRVSWCGTGFLDYCKQLKN